MDGKGRWADNVFVERLWRKRQSKNREPFLEAMTIGIRTFRTDRWRSWLSGMTALLFSGKKQDYAINRGQLGTAHEQ